MREEIIITLTTWSQRINNIPFVLDSIYCQTVIPDKVVLNLSEGEIVPDFVQSYIDIHHIEVYRVLDTKVYKKLVPTLLRYPDACVISIDDDWIYPSNMIEDFMRVHKSFPHSPISGNRLMFGRFKCHCGCASLTKAEYFGANLMKIDNDVICNCSSDDIVYTYFAAQSGHFYVMSDDEYFENMKPFNQVESYSSSDCSSIWDSWDYLINRYGPISRTYVFLWLLNKKRLNKQFKSINNSSR